MSGSSVAGGGCWSYGLAAELIKRHVEVGRSWRVRRITSMDKGDDASFTDDMAIAAGR